MTLAINIDNDSQQVVDVTIVSDLYSLDDKGQRTAKAVATTKPEKMQIAGHSQSTITSSVGKRLMNMSATSAFAHLVSMPARGMSKQSSVS